MTHAWDRSVRVVIVALLATICVALIGCLEAVGPDQPGPPVDVPPGTADTGDGAGDGVVDPPGGSTEPPTGSTEPPAGGTDPIEPPSTREGCDYLNDIMNSRIVQVADGPWEGWCMESSDSPVGGGPGGSRGFHHREALFLESEMGNQGRAEFDVMVPEAWYFAGGAHFFQVTNGGCPNDLLANCLRMDWQQPKDRGFRVGVYNSGSDETGTPVVPLYASRQVLWPDSFTHVVFEYTYTPATGALSMTIEYTNSEHGVNETVSGSTTAATNVDNVGQFAKWGRMHPSTDEGRHATCWLKNDRYSRR